MFHFLNFLKEIGQFGYVWSSGWGAATEQGSRGGSVEYWSLWVLQGYGRLWVPIISFTFSFFLLNFHVIFRGEHDTEALILTTRGAKLSTVLPTNILLSMMDVVIFIWKDMLLTVRMCVQAALPCAASRCSPVRWPAPQVHARASLCWTASAVSPQPRWPWGPQSGNDTASR